MVVSLTALALPLPDGILEGVVGLQTPLGHHPARHGAGVVGAQPLLNGTPLICVPVTCISGTALAGNVVESMRRSWQQFAIEGLQ